MQHFDVAVPEETISSVLIVDDHPLYSDALASALGGVFADCQVEKAGSLKAALALLESGFHPDLVMFDLVLPDVNGISGFISLRAHVPDIPILVISSMTSHVLVTSLMNEGAAGFLPKDTPANVIQTVLAEIAAGRKYVPKDYRQARPAETPEDLLENIHPKLAALTPQQQKVMKLICEGKPNKQIAYELDLAEATVKAHITALLRRLGVSNRTQAALMVEAAHAQALESVEEPEALSFLCR
ncbi:LuxR C-terminal-related transcriptional regulator [Primorskyibacter flagellatus]|uniref:Two component transcriptional regulator, LuxR family n=1 Tax=Primorskyibacter flagellatus TaxID=1387277 RepID=A0A1W2A492_9RHOB|nr:response regulator transcription factor [Primorskyibacter flagellatus]SMC55497.1 two component transcriptional regulator, LuxR family [Primorskyibacter flagellatus]